MYILEHSYVSLIISQDISYYISNDHVPDISAVDVGTIFNNTSLQDGHTQGPLVATKTITRHDII